MRIRYSTCITIGAAGAALAILMLLAASILPTMRLACLYLASLFCCPLACEGEPLYGFVCFLTAGICALLLSSVKIYALLFLLFFGHYIQFQVFIERRIFSVAGRFLIKAVYCHAFALMTLFGISLLIPHAFDSIAPKIKLIIAVSCQIGFIILDRLNHITLHLYHTRIQPKLFPHQKR